MKTDWPWKIGALSVIVTLMVLVYFATRTPPQMGPDAQVFETVDALYTAVRNHDTKQVAKCEERLKNYRQAGQLPTNAAEHLDRIIAKTQSGSWDSAAAKLYDFMLAQRREGK
jgi:isocitrate lyase